MTSPLRALIVEDEWAARNYLIELLHATERVVVVGAVETVAAAIEVIHARGTPSFDVAFVDIRLAGDPADGLSLVRREVALPNAPRFVLVTALKEHAIEAFDLGVADYLLKPVTLERVRQCVDRLVPYAKPSEPPRIVARQGKTLVFLEFDEVWAFEACGRLTFVHTARGRFDVDVSLAAMDAALGGRLHRVHRNWLARIDQVRELARDDGEMHLCVGSGDNTVSVPVARERASAVKDMLLEASVGVSSKRPAR